MRQVAVLRNGPRSIADLTASGSRNPAPIEIASAIGEISWCRGINVALRIRGAPSLTALGRTVPSSKKRAKIHHAVAVKPAAQPDTQRHPGPRDGTGSCFRYIDIRKLSIWAVTIFRFVRLATPGW